jgi:uncharacterized protein (DUF433 family)
MILNATEVPMRMSAIVHRDPQILGGAPVFVGTRVPLQALLDHLEDGDTIDTFLESFPTVTREQVIGFLEQATDALLEAIPQHA